MRYLTKEWYYTMNDSGLGVCLEADDRAAAYSEEVYQTLRAEKLAQWLSDRAEVCEITEEPFDPEEERQKFDDLCAHELEQYRARTPGHILSKVADLRVLALGFCTEEVWQDFEDFRSACEERTEQTMTEAWEACRAEGLDKIWTGEYSLHDSRVLSFGWEGEDLVLEFERENPRERLREIEEDDPELLEEHGPEEFLWPEVKKIIFPKARILTWEKSPENAWWLYDEIYRSERGCEIHALLYQDGLCELTVECADVKLIWTM